MSLIGRLIDKLLAKGSITLKLPGKAPRTHGGGGGKHLTVRFTDRMVGFDILRNPRLGFGEAYMDGRLVIEDGTILDLMEMIVGANRWEEMGEGRRALRKGKLTRTLKRLLLPNDVKRARKNVAHHYDIGNDLYELFLDDDLQYSCAYFTDTANSLERAQLEKKAHIAAKLALEPGQRVLDIGCGWGGMALFLHKVAGVDVLGVTLSEEQLKVARHRAAEAGVSDHVRFELIDYRLVEEQFDRIVSVGMFEHVGKPQYPKFFAAIARLLDTKGIALLHAIGRMRGPGLTSAWIRRYIFPGGYIPALSDVAPVVERSGLWLTDLEVLHLHYAETLRHWRQRFLANRASLADLYDDRFCRMWEFYLAASETSFRHGGFMVFQAQLSHALDAAPLTRDYMTDADRN
ncbi:MAG TPA: cyclopropane-fatty-acyl-phospholipid synthase family protein [Sphingomicrobium sp.]|nr:cyclopropane-fatty-acyl-phospholipid synthase family protein [Sphingomicrobium sp.]